MSSLIRFLARIKQVTRGMSTPFGLGRFNESSRGNRLSVGYWTSVTNIIVLLGTSGHRSLGAPLAHIEGSTYLGPRKPLTTQRGHSQSIHLCPRPSELLQEPISILHQSPLSPLSPLCTLYVTQSLFSFLAQESLEPSPVQEVGRRTWLHEYRRTWDTF